MIEEEKDREWGDRRQILKREAKQIKFLLASQNVTMNCEYSSYNYRSQIMSKWVTF